VSKQTTFMALTLRPLSITHQLLALTVELPPACVIKHESLVGIFTHKRLHAEPPAWHHRFKE